MSTNKKFSQIKEDEIIKLYTIDNKTQEEISKIYNTYNTSIRRVLLRNNIEIRGNSDIQKFINYEDFISKKDTNEFYYFIGLLASDGCITGNRVVLDFSNKNKELLNY